MPAKIHSIPGVLSILLLMAGCGYKLPEEVRVASNDLPETVDFNFHIKPILSDRCYKCHGPDDNARKAEFRLDLKERAFAKLKVTGGHAFVRGNPGKSVAWQRITSDDLDFQMPPPESNLSLTALEKALITKWIEQGAEWKEHWAFIPPQKPLVPLGEIPGVDNQLVRNPIDNFIIAKSREKGLSPSPEAIKERLIRRLSFDLTGLPPSTEKIDKFLSDGSPQAYEKLVDRLLASDAHAERMAMEWMDVARYADSHGLHADGLRSMWPWRDWVIKAFKKNLSYDDFVTWQIAGDLLPGATREQILATGFHRNHPLNSELGIISEEFRLKYAADRTNTTATAFMGLTMECATCHDHKFDPISQKEYYQLFSFFNNVHELGMIGNDRNFGPLLLLPEPEKERQLARLTMDVDGVESEMDLTRSQVQAIGNFVDKVESLEVKAPVSDGFYPFETISALKTGDKDDITVRYGYRVLDSNPNSYVTGDPELIQGKSGKAIRLDGDYDIIYLGGIGNFNLYEPFSAGSWLRIETIGIYQAIMGNIGAKNDGWRGWIFFLDTLGRPSFKMVHSLSHNYMDITADTAVPLDKWTHVLFTYDGSARASGLQIYINGKAVDHQVKFDRVYKSILPRKGRNYEADPERKIRMGIGQEYLFADDDDGALAGSLDQVSIFKHHLTSVEVAALLDLEDRTLPRQEQLMHYLHRVDRKFMNLIDDRSKLLKKKFSLLDSVSEVMVMEEMPEPRKTFVLERGQYDMPGEEVTANTPNAIMPFAESLPLNRLGLSRWLFDDNHPLTARVTVNRYWQMIFGRGIVETTNDFGSQGALPSHPELLDWLAVEFRDSGWDLRHLIKLMVTSATYRQSSAATQNQLIHDAGNIYLSRAPSYRLSIEMIRDNALFASGLLNRQIGGPSVKPYQPEGMWKEKNEFSGFLKVYKPDSGEKLYRRSLYTFIRRTSPPPAMTTFDMPSREVCVVKRENTSTPLQALILLNDPQFVEAARVLAERIQKEGGNALEDQTRYAFRLVTGRQPSSAEFDLLMDQYQTEIQRFEKDLRSAVELLEVGEYLL